MKKKLFTSIKLNESNEGSRQILAVYGGREFRIERGGDGVIHLASRDGARVTSTEFKAIRLLLESFWTFITGGEPESISYLEAAALSALVPFMDWSEYGPEGEPGEREILLTDCAAHFTDF